MFVNDEIEVLDKSTLINFERNYSITMDLPLY